MKIRTLNRMMDFSRLLLLTATLLSCSRSMEPVDNRLCEVTFEPDLTSLVRNPVSGWTLYDDANDDVSDAQRYWAMQDMAASRFASIFYWRSRWSELEPQEGRYAWDNDENFKALLQGALDRGLKLAFCVYVDGQDNISNATPDFVRDAGANGYPSHRLWDPEGVDNNWSPYVDDPVFQEKFSNFIRAFAEEFDDPDRVDYIDAFNLGWWGEGHHIKYMDPASKASVYQWITRLYGENFHNVILVTNFGTEMGLDYEKRFAVREQDFVIRRNSLGSTWFRDTEIKTVGDFFPGCPFIAEGCYWGSNDDAYQPWSEDPLYKDVFHSWTDFYSQSFNDAIRSHANTLDLREIAETKGWTQRALPLVKEFVSKGGYRFTPVSVSWPYEVTEGSMVKVRHQWRNSGVGMCPNNNRRWNYKYKVSFALFKGTEKVWQYVDENTDPSSWLYGKDMTYECEFDPELPCGAYMLSVCVADTSKEGNPPGLALAVKGKDGRGWLDIGTINISK